MRHARQRELDNAPANIQIHDLRGNRLDTLAACAADRVTVALVEEEVFQGFIQARAPHPQETGLGQALAHFVVMHQTIENGFGLWVIGNLPQFRDVFQRRDETVTGCGVVDGGYP